MRLTRRTMCRAYSRKASAAAAAEQIPHLPTRLAETRGGQSRASVLDDSSLLLFWRRFPGSSVQVNIADIGGCGRKRNGPRDLFAFLVDSNRVSPRREIAENVCSAGAGLYFLRKFFQAH